MSLPREIENERLCTSLLEKTLAKTKPGYQEYVRRTRAFFPWFPKREEK